MTTSTSLPANRIKLDLQEKRRIVSFLEERLWPLFRELGCELTNAGSDILGSDMVCEDWIELIKELYGSLDPLGGKHPRSAVKPMLDILDAYSAAIGIKLRHVYMDEAWMLSDEMRLDFDCPQWADLFKKELGSTFCPLTQVILALNHFDPANGGEVGLESFMALKVSDVRAAEQHFSTYWDEAITWAKWRNPAT